MSPPSSTFLATSSKANLAQFGQMFCVSTHRLLELVAEQGLLTVASDLVSGRGWLSNGFLIQLEPVLLALIRSPLEGMDAISFLDLFIPYLLGELSRKVLSALGDKGDRLLLLDVTRRFGRDQSGMVPTEPRDDEVWGMEDIAANDAHYIARGAARGSRMELLRELIKGQGSL